MPCRYVCWTRAAESERWQFSRNEGLERIDLHDRKALEWLENLEEWLHRSEGELHAAAHRNRGQRLARQAQAALPGKRESAKKR